ALPPRSISREYRVGAGRVQRGRRRRRLLPRDSSLRGNAPVRAEGARADWKWTGRCRVGAALDLPLPGSRRVPDLYEYPAGNGVKAPLDRSGSPLERMASDLAVPGEVEEAIEEAVAQERLRSFPRGAIVHAPESRALPTLLLHLDEDLFVARED